MSTRKRMGIYLGLIFWVPFFIFTVTTVWANDVHVDIVNANDIEDGSAKHPFSSIQAGIDAVSEGGVVLIHEGNYELDYEESIVINKEGITLKAVDPNKPPLICRKVDWGDVYGFIKESYLLDIKAKKAQIERIRFDVTGPNRWAILVGQNTDFKDLVTIKDCVVESSDNWGGGGIKVDGFSGSLEIYHNFISGIAFAPAIKLNNSGAGQFVKIYNNIILYDYNQYTPCLIILSIDSRSWIYNNYIYGGKISMMVYNNKNPRWNYVIDNIIEGFHGTAIVSANGGVFPYPYIRVYYNDIVSNWSENLFKGISSSWVACNFSLDPLFKDPENGDFHLKPDSPCIDAGMPSPTYNDTDGSRGDCSAYGGPQGYW